MADYCNSLVKSKLAPFVAKYGTRLKFDMDLFQQLTDVQLIYAMSDKLNEMVCFDNGTRDIAEEFARLVVEIQDEWENVKDSMGPEIIEAVNEVVNEYLGSDEFKLVINESVSKAVDDATSGYDARFEQIEEDIDSIQNTLGRVVNVLDYGADANGAEDSYQAVYNAIASASEGDTVLFPHGSYRIDSQVELKSGVTYDFDGSEVVLLTRGFTLSGTQTGAYSSSTSYTACSDSIPYAVADADSLVFVYNSLQQGAVSRDYFRRGFLCKPVEAGSSNYTRVCPTYPYDINSGLSITVYSPATAVIENVGNVRFTSPQYSNTDQTSVAFHLRYCSGATVRNCHWTGGMYAGVDFERCYGSVVEGCASELDTTANGCGYGVVVIECTDTLITGMHGNQYWHCVSTGGTYNTLNTFVSDSFLYSNGSPGYLDHANTLNSVLSGCVLTGGCSVGAGSKVLGCKVCAQYNGTADVATIDLISSSIDGYGNDFSVRDCTIETENDVAFYTGVRLFNENLSNSSQSFTYNTVVVDNVQRVGGNSVMPILLTRTAHTGDPIAISSLTVSNVHNPYVWTRSNDSNTASVETLTMRDCIVEYGEGVALNLIETGTANLSECGRCVFDNVDFRSYNNYWYANLTMFESLTVSNCHIVRGQTGYFGAPKVYMVNNDVDWQGANVGQLAIPTDTLYIENTVLGVTEGGYFVSGIARSQGGVSYVYLPYSASGMVRGTPSSTGLTWTDITVS